MAKIVELRLIVEDQVDERNLMNDINGNLSYVYGIALLRGDGFSRLFPDPGMTTDYTGMKTSTPEAEIVKAALLDPSRVHEVE